MSGHSKWSTIKHKKAAQDAKKGKIFTKLGRAITIAAREGGGDIETNFALRLAVDSAKRSSMPQDNIERAINRGTGEGDEGVKMERAVYGGYGPGGIAVAVDVFTDNKNRTVSELRKIFESHGGSLSDASSVLWQFKEKGKLIVKCAKLEKSEKYGEEDKEVPVERNEVMMKLMDVDGIEDVSEYDEEGGDNFKFCEVVTEPKKLAKVRNDIDKLGYIVDSAEMAKIPDNTQSVDDAAAEKLRALFEDLDDHDDVENIWFNADDI
ncbi:YebC/PmpR family DNA-binding transcriptional regulator [Candidatus Dojkabacteria bacterium]|nr:YebC/PmpR family DNA-binding transcriptional regulator [Candidatus Dojkabacteria bacterium]